ncbi:AraC family transcriptional regulator [Mycobacterium lentiflavum]|uniref:AraC family transcriptional regulator n=1 Tax=Mycobacterium lentiflavum TaxID=141349 RepID=A0A0E4GVU1_MYCLN|nr:helix-turn-helix domain-containing protein [Mycobacterium lentiflavum]CQD07234.1 AraC family transcriptional regulator [Mycobacterium lentiflavum]
MARDANAIAVVLFDRAPMFETAVPLNVFGADHTDAGVPAFRLLVIAGEKGLLTTTGGLIVEAPFDLDALSEASIVVLPSWRDPAERPPEPALAAIRAAHADGATIVSFCLGGFVLAATGLLDGRRAVMHWFHTPTLAAMYPEIRVDGEALFSDDGDIVTAAGTGAALDACLHVIERIWDQNAVTVISQRMIMAPRRVGTRPQLRYLAPSKTGSSSAVAQVMTFAMDHIAEPFGVDELARKAGLSRRTFDRHFRDLAGMPAMQWLVWQRVFRAQRLLEESGDPIEDIARRSGFKNPLSLRRQFYRHLGVSPMHYRRQHGRTTAARAASRLAEIDR